MKKRPFKNVSIPETKPRQQRDLNFRARRSVTIFGEILPFWQKFTGLWQIFSGLLLIWHNAEPASAILLHYRAKFHNCKWPNIEK